MGGFNKSKQSQSGWSSSGVNFPYAFLNSASQVLGDPFSTDQLASMLPQSRSVFGGSYGNASQYAVPNQQQAQTDPQYSIEQIMGAFPRLGSQRVQAWEARDSLANRLRDVGASDQGATIGQITQAIGDGSWAPDLWGGNAQGAVDALTSYDALVRRQQAQGVSPSFGGEPVGPAGSLDSSLYGGTGYALRQLGFGQQAPQAEVPTIGQAPRVGAARTNSVQSMAQPGDFTRYESSLYNSVFNPVRRELTRQRDDADTTMLSQLAQAGLASSGTGIGQRAKQSEEFGRRIEDASQDASSQAAQMRYEQQFRQQEANAAREQEARLQNAGFHQQAQVANASNVLQGNIAQSDAYLKTIGLNAENAAVAQRNFLDLLRIEQDDIRRMDDTQRGNIEALFNAWLQQFSALTDAGRQQETQNVGAGSGFGMNIVTGGGGDDGLAALFG